MITQLMKRVQPVILLAVLVSCGGDPKSAEEKEKDSPAEQAQELTNEQSAENNSSGEPMEVSSFEQPAPELRNQVNSLLDDYMALKNQLTESSAEGAAEAAKSFLGKIENFQATGLPEDQQGFYSERTESVKKFVQNTSEKPNLEAQREHLSAITENMYALSKAFKAGEEGLYYQFCPMAFNNNGGYWLSSSTEIRNPYFGEKMLKCGRVTETLSQN